jgi:hypothetical protein
MASNERISPVDEVQLLRAAACDWRLSRGDVAVLAVILEHCDSELRAFPGPARIAKAANLAVTNVKRSLKKLEQLRYLGIEHRGVRRRSGYVVKEAPQVPTRRAGVPSSNLKKGHDSARERAQFGVHEMGTTGYESITPTGRASIHQLGTLARHEVAFKTPLKSQGALLTPEEQEQQRLQKQAERSSLRAEYEASLTTHPKHAEMMAKTWPWLKDAA